jgi:hypothetical protein
MCKAILGKKRYQKNPSAEKRASLTGIHFSDSQELLQSTDKNVGAVNLD